MTLVQPENEDEFAGGEAMVYAFASGQGLAPGQGGTVFAATSGGLLRSSDGGQSWIDPLTGVQLTAPLPVTCVAVVNPDPSASASSGQLVIAGSVGGFFRSIDGGESWQMLVFPTPPPTVSSLAHAYTADHELILFAGTMEDGVFISLDRGQHWAGWNFGLLDLNVMCVAVSPNFAQDETLYAGTETGLFRSTNGGRAWRDLDLPFGFDPVLSLACAPDGSLTLGTESQGLWATADEGQTWRQLGAFAEPINAILLSRDPQRPGELLVVTSNALLRTGDGGATWASCLAEDAAEAEISALLAPQGIGPGAPVLLGLVDGSMRALRLR